MSTLLEYKCPKCGGAIEFDSASQQMKCSYCDSLFDVETMKSYDEAIKNEPDKMQWEKTSGNSWAEDELKGMSVYTCESCGGEIICGTDTSAALCPYCDNPVVMKGNFSGALRPDCIIPFKLDKKSAKESLYNHIKGKKLLPKIFKDENHIDEIKGVYVPFWLFDCDTDSKVNYNAQRLRHWSDGKYDYTETSYYLVRKEGLMSFDRIPVDGSSQMPDDLMESIEPYDFREAVDFQTAYLVGYLADKYDVTSEQSIERANQRVKISVEEGFKRFMQGYSSITVKNSSINLIKSNVRYALYPVWILNTSWNDKKYTFAMNGQTGKFVGDLPMDKRLFWKWFGAVFAVTSLISLAIGFLL